MYGPYIGRKNPIATSARIIVARHRRAFFVPLSCATRARGETRDVRFGEPRVDFTEIRRPRQQRLSNLDVVPAVRSGAHRHRPPGASHPARVSHREGCARGEPRERGLGLAEV
jgi:hypothetical protein